MMTISTNATTSMNISTSNMGSNNSNTGRLLPRSKQHQTCCSPQCSIRAKATTVYPPMPLESEIFSKRRVVARNKQPLRAVISHDAHLLLLTNNSGVEKKDSRYNDPSCIPNREANTQRLVELIKTFKEQCWDATSTSNNATVDKHQRLISIRPTGCRFQNGKLDIDLVVGPENRFIHVSTIVYKNCEAVEDEPSINRNGRRRRRSTPTTTMGRRYSFMTRIAKINAMLAARDTSNNIHVRICQGQLTMALESLDVSLLLSSDGQLFFDRLRTFLTNATSIEHELCRTSKA